MRLSRTEALLYFPALIIGGMCSLIGLAWVYEKTRKKIQHPKLGAMTYYDNGWVVFVAHYNPKEGRVRVEIPGSKAGPEEPLVDNFERFWERIQETVATVRPHAIASLEDDYDATDDPLIQAILERTSQSHEHLDQDWQLSQVSLIQGRDQKYYWYLEFQVSWDEEHQRAAYLDLEGHFLRYEMSCSVVEL